MTLQETIRKNLNQTAMIVTEKIKEKSKQQQTLRQENKQRQKELDKIYADTYKQQQVKEIKRIAIEKAKNKYAPKTRQTQINTQSQPTITRTIGQPSYSRIYTPYQFRKY